MNKISSRGGSMFSSRGLGVLIAVYLILVASVADSHGLPWLKKAQLMKAMQSDKIIHFIVWLKPRNQQALKENLSAIYNPNSPRYRQFFTGQQIAERFMPTSASEQKMLNYFLEHGVQAKLVSHSIRIDATVAQVEALFHVKMNYYKYHNRLIFSNATQPLLDKAITHDVLEISGLSNWISPKPMIQKPYFKPSLQPNALPTVTTIGGITGENLAFTYNLQNIRQYHNTHIDGSGQTVVIIDACDNYSAVDIQADANIYNINNGFPLLSSANFAVVNSDGTEYTSCATPGDTGWHFEIALDVQAAHTTAQAANMVLVLADSNELLFATEIDVINQLINNHTLAGFEKAYVISNSWGEPELSGVVSPALETSLQLAALNGLSIQFSSGDCGDNNYTSSVCSNNGLHVNYPASSGFVTAVGGTSLFTDEASRYAFESGWGSYVDGGFVFGSGGGVSGQIEQPVWQTPIQDFYAGGYGIVGSHYRAVPDIGMLGDPFTGLVIYYNGTNYTFGGTSLSSPLLTGSLALVNQARFLVSEMQQPIGHLAPTLYLENSLLKGENALNLIVPPHPLISGTVSNPDGAPDSAFTLIVDGSHLVTFSWDSALTIEPETQFWNDVVGVGSPNIPNFVSALSGVI